MWLTRNRSSSTRRSVLGLVFDLIDHNNEWIISQLWVSPNSTVDAYFVGGALGNCSLFYHAFGVSHLSQKDTIETIAKTSSDGQMSVVAIPLHSKHRIDSSSPKLLFVTFQDWNPIFDWISNCPFYAISCVNTYAMFYIHSSRSSMDAVNGPSFISIACRLSCISWYLTTHSPLPTSTTLEEGLSLGAFIHSFCLDCPSRVKDALLISSFGSGLFNLLVASNLDCSQEPKGCSVTDRTAMFSATSTLAFTLPT